jgi:hypothetical protein
MTHEQLILEVDSSLVEHILSWAGDLAGFAHHHAFGGAAFAQAVINHLCGADSIETRSTRVSNSIFVIAADTAFTLWIDDRLDRKTSEGGLLEPLSLLRLASADSANTSVEAKGFAMLSELLQQHAHRQEDFLFWRQTAFDMFHAFVVNDGISGRRAEISYAEYLEIGLTSIAAFHLLASICLIFGYHLPERMQEPVVSRAMRNLCASLRLGNDLVSLGREQHDAVHANAVLLLQRHLNHESALAFVTEQKIGYERLLSQELAMLPPTDPMTRVILAVQAATEQFYTTTNIERYSVPT